MPLNSGLLGLDDGTQEQSSILIVDDLAEKLLVFETVLESLGQNLVVVRSGNEALREILKQEFAVILLDVNMPDIDGFETAAMIRKYKRSAHTPIIFITSFADEVQMAKGYALGAVDYMLSPVMPEMLRSKVKVFVELHVMQRRMQRQASERIALAAAEAARLAAEENTRRFAFLSQASRVLSASLDVDAGMRNLLTLVVPELSMGASLLLLERVDRVIVCEKRTALSAPMLRECSLTELRAPERQGMQDAFARREHINLPPRTVGSAGQTVVPLVIADRCLGALMVQTSGSEEDWSLLDELAHRAAIAFENARLYRSLQNEIEERRRAEVRLLESNRRKDEFLAMLSHELRNPLAPIRNAVQVVRLIAPPHPKLLWATEVMERQVNHLTRLVEELLDVSRISQGKIVLKVEEMDLAAAIAHGVETVRLFIDARQITLAQHLPPEPVWLHGDAARLSQVVANLLNNAAKYTQEGGTIHLALEVDSGRAVVCVKDNGMGIDADLLPNVFELFEQGKRSLDRSQGGLGVGLTLVQRLVQLHDGQVEVRSDGPGQGAEFKVTLPCIKSAAGTPQTEMTLAVQVAPIETCRVLVVDDNRDAAETTALFLELAGHEVKTVSDGMQALDCAVDFGPDVVVLDIGLPLMDGYEVARRLRAAHPTRDALLIALTGYGQQTDRQQAKDAGFDAHLVKPAEPHVLTRLISDWSTAVPGKPLCLYGAL